MCDGGVGGCGDNEGRGACKDMSGAWGHVDQAQDVWAGHGGLWGPSSMGHKHGAHRGH